MDEKKLVVILWTGGWDSTFRMIQLACKDNIIIQPVYIKDKVRKGSAYELLAMDKILSILRSEFPATIEDLLIFDKPDILNNMANEEISAAYRYLHENYKIGAQYEWFALLTNALQVKMECAVVDSMGEAKSRQCISGEGYIEELQDGCLGSTYVIRAKGENKAIERVMGSLYMPLLKLSKRQAQKISEDNGWMDIMKLTWFCHSPINEAPCGLCNPCVDAMEFGMEWRMPMEAKERFYNREQILADARREIEAEKKERAANICGLSNKELEERKAYHTDLYERVTGRRLDLANPGDLNQKLQWLMIYRYDRNVSKYADKLRVRDYVRKCGYQESLPEIYGVYEHVWDIKLESLPKRFVLKCNHGSGPKFYSMSDDILCGDAKRAESELMKLEQALSLDYSRIGGEYHYHYIKPYIYAEEYLGDNPTDYKFFCVNGEPKFVKVIADRAGGKHQDYYDMDWSFRPMVKDEISMGGHLPKPANFDIMKKMAATLASPFPVARVDLYEVDGKAVFGEITLTPATGLNRTDKPETLELIGNMIDLSGFTGEGLEFEASGELERFVLNI